MTIGVLKDGALVVLGSKDNDRLEEIIGGTNGTKLGGVKGIGYCSVNGILASKDDGELVIPECGSDTIDSIESMIVEILADRLIGCIKDNSSELNSGSRKADDNAGSSLPASCHGEDIGTGGELSKRPTAGYAVVVAVIAPNNTTGGAENVNLSSRSSDSTWSLAVVNKLDPLGIVGGWTWSGNPLMEK